MSSWVPLSEIVRNLGLLVVAAFGLYLGWKRVVAANRQAEAQTEQAKIQARQAELSRRDHVAELFNRAVGQLTDPKIEVRLGAIYTLRQICTDFEDLSEPVIQLLSTYLRENRVDYGDSPPPADIGEITALLRARMEERK